METSSAKPLASPSRKAARRAAKAVARAESRAEVCCIVCGEYRAEVCCIVCVVTYKSMRETLRVPLGEGRIFLRPFKVCPSALGPELGGANPDHGIPGRTRGSGWVFGRGGLLSKCMVIWWGGRLTL